MPPKSLLKLTVPTSVLIFAESGTKSWDGSETKRQSNDEDVFENPSKAPKSNFKAFFLALYPLRHQGEFPLSRDTCKTLLNASQKSS